MGRGRRHQTRGHRGAALTKQLLAFSRPQRAATTIVDLAAMVGSMEPVLRRLVLDKIVIA